MVEKKVLPFQQLMTRKRKDVKAEDITVKVCVFAFDILYLNGEVSLAFYVMCTSVNTFSPL
jgi:DNA ligase-1